MNSFSLFFALLVAMMIPAQAFDTAKLAEIGSTIDEALKLGLLPGAVVHIEAKGHVYQKAYGSRAVKPRRERMTTDTIFDMASLTKVMATAPSIMILIERGKLKLDQTVHSHFPNFKGHGKEPITIRQLLTHTSGLKSGFPKDDRPKSYELALERIFADEPKITPGSDFIYSDLNFILLGELVAKVSGQSLADFAKQNIWQPLKMTETNFLPSKSLKKRIAPTEKYGLGYLRGVVHDPTSRQIGGVTGHAGVFSTPHDVARYGRMILNRGKLDGARVLSEASVRQMTQVQELGRGYGWDVDSWLANLPRGDHFTAGKSFGHTGWTGTSIWIDPTKDIFLAILTNRNHPRGGDVRKLRGKIANLAILAAAELKRKAEPEPASKVEVKNGIDRLVDSNFEALAGLKVGLITNHTGLNREGKSTIDLLHEAKNVELKALFGPEHGIRGKLDQAKIKDGVDTKTGLNIYSLYGDSRKPPSAKLKGLDALVFDIQDIGCRFYTYISTMGLAMEAAADLDLKFIVLDRVNPIGGDVVDGPVKTSEKKFVSHHPIAIQHGMTVGELAKMFQAEKKIDLDLSIIPISGWARSMRFNQTGLTWVNPSPNMRSLEAAMMYPGIGLLEFSNLSVGRGTETPFEHAAAPYIDSEKLVTTLNAQNHAGLKIETTSYRPTASKFKGEHCHGVKFTITDPSKMRSFDAGLTIAKYLSNSHRGYEIDKLEVLLVHPKTLAAIKAQKSNKEIRALWADELKEFRKRRARYLLYR